MNQKYSIIFVLFLFFDYSVEKSTCPRQCACALLTVVCTGQSLDSIPKNIPSGTIRLDLQQNKILQITRNDFVNLTSLKYLDLSNNGLEKIEEDAFADLINLERIRLNKNKLRNLPENLFHRMERLHRLDLSENQLEILTNGHIVGPSLMRNLQLDKNKLTCIEMDVIKEWTSLEIFTLNSNRLTTLDELNPLPNLRIFRIFDNPWLCDCRLRWISQIFNSTTVINAKCHRPMMLQGRNLIQINQNEMKCSGIEKRSAGGCADKKRCPAECACTATIVDCHDRSLAEIPTNLPNGIEEIRLNGNRITSIPIRVEEEQLLCDFLVVTVHFRDLSRNQINEIAPDAFEGLSMLQHLHLFHNNISHLEYSTFHGLTELEMLMLNANNLGCLPKDLFRDLRKLHMLSIYKNKIQSIENGTFDPLDSVKAVHLSENPYICDCNLAWLANFLREKKLLDTSGVKCVFPRRMSGILLASADSEKFKCKGSEYLTTKNSGRCLIDHPCPSECVCFGTVVDCSNRGFFSIPEKLPKFTSTLLLNKNNLKVISGYSIQKAVNLEKIDLSENNITEIEKDTFRGLSSLKELVLNDNQLTKFDPRLAGINSSKIERLHLNNNLLECIAEDILNPLTNLTLLSLSGNPLKAFEQGSLKSLSSLRSLYLAKNHLICNCGLFEGLKSLSSTTQILDSPYCADSDGKEHLVTVYLKKAEKTCLKTKNKKICTFDGSYCPPECECVGTVVRCSNAGLSEVPKNLPATTTELYLTNNEISEVNPDDFRRLTKLVRLDLSKNNLRILNDFVFSKLQKLEILILAFNKLQCLGDYSFSGLNSLRILSLHGNNLSQLTELTFSNLTKNLQQIAALNNPFFCDCQLAWFHRWIRDNYVESGLSKCNGPTSMTGQVILTAPSSSFVCNGQNPVPHDVLAKCNPCLDSPCQNGGICKKGTNKSYECKCDPFYYGEHCERPIDACYGNPCANDGQCHVVEEGRFKCSCKKGFVGGHCEINIDDCVAHKCKNGGTCVDEVNDYHCLCPSNYAGKYCEDKIEVCSSYFNPCKNGANCEPLGNSSYKCHCTPNFTGQNCSSQIDNCLPNSCNNNGICKSTKNGFTCECAAGFVGEFCETPLLPSMMYYRSEVTCNSDNCVHGTCVRSNEDEPRCECHFGYSGDQCSIQNTIGFEEDGAHVSIASSEKNSSSSIESLSFTLRTTFSSGILFYFGDETQFVSSELYDGRIRIALSIGRNDPSLMYSYYKLNNGQAHNIRIEMKDNQLTLFFDDKLPQTLVNKGRTKKMEIKSKQLIYIGGLPEGKLKTALQSYRIVNNKSFSGCISNLKISGFDIDFNEEGTVIKHKTVSGCGRSVDLCNDVTCGGAGKCVENSTVPQGYECRCNVSYTGKNCEKRIPTCNKVKFREHYQESGCRSLEPIKNAICVGWCGNEKLPFIRNPDGSATGKNCCCKAVKIRQKKVRMSCPDGSRRTTLVQIVRKCQCSMCST